MRCVVRPVIAGPPTASKGGGADAVELRRGSALVGEVVGGMRDQAR